MSGRLLVRKDVRLGEQTAWKKNDWKHYTFLKHFLGFLCSLLQQFSLKLYWYINNKNHCTKCTFIFSHSHIWFTCICYSPVCDLSHATVSFTIPAVHMLFPGVNSFLQVNPEKVCSYLDEWVSDNFVPGIFQALASCHRTPKTAHSLMCIDFYLHS